MWTFVCFLSIFLLYSGTIFFLAYKIYKNFTLFLPGLLVVGDNRLQIQPYYPFNTPPQNSPTRTSYYCAIFLNNLQQHSHIGENVKNVPIKFVDHLFIHLIRVFRLTQEYFTYSMTSGILGEETVQSLETTLPTSR